LIGAYEPALLARRRARPSTSVLWSGATAHIVSAMNNHVPRPVLTVKLQMLSRSAASWLRHAVPAYAKSLFA